MPPRILNLTAPLVDRNGRIIPPWNTFFQGFVNKAIPVQDISIGATSPIEVNQNDNGHFLVSGGTVTAIRIVRGSATLLVYNDTAAPRLVPVSLGDVLSVDWNVTAPTIKFIPQ